MAYEKSVKLIKEWLVSYGLDLAENKTEAILVSSPKLKEVLWVRVRQNVIESKLLIKHLDVMLNHKLKFKGQLLELLYLA